MKMKWYLLVVAAVVLWSGLIYGQQTAPPATSPDVPASREDIRRLFEAMHVQEQIRTSMEVMMTQQRRMIAEMMKKRNRRVTRDDVDRASESAQEFLKNFPLDEMVEDMIPVYQRHLTRADVDAMAAFYSSPTGQKLLREQPAMAGESMQAVSARVQRAVALAIDQAEKKAREDDEKEMSPPAQTPEQHKN